MNLNLSPPRVCPLRRKGKKIESPFNAVAKGLLEYNSPQLLISFLQKHLLCQTWPGAAEGNRKREADPGEMEALPSTPSNVLGLFLTAALALRQKQLFTAPRPGAPAPRAPLRPRSAALWVVRPLEVQPGAHPPSQQRLREHAL